VAAYRAVELCRRLEDAGACVRPILTDNATRFVGTATFAAVASETPRTSLWESVEASPHTAAGQWADIVVVAPATARIIASYALGISDDLLATTLLASRAPLVLCPAMHTEMWEHPAVQENVATLRRRGTYIVEPTSGHLAGGDVGPGRLADPAEIIQAVARVLALGRRLSGRTIIVTAGGTREPLDAVRYIGNRSSGRQGHAIAEVALGQGARVVLITASSLAAPPGAEVLEVATGAEMHDAVLEHLPAADSLIMAAAVADFRPATVYPDKWKKADGAPPIVLEPTTDILAAVAEKRRANQVVVGFAAETNFLEELATDKLRAKRLDIIVANEVNGEGTGFEHMTNRVLIIDKNARTLDTGLVDKHTVAASVIEWVAAALDAAQSVD